MIDYFRQRYKVIADWPDSPFDIGECLEQDKILFKIDKYPHLFRKLEWYEGRCVAELPDYLRQIDGGKIDKVIRYSIDGKYSAYYTGKKYKSRLFGLIDEPFNVGATVPATEEEYNQYITTNGLQLNSDK